MRLSELARWVRMQLGRRQMLAILHERLDYRKPDHTRESTLRAFEHCMRPYNWHRDRWMGSDV